MVEKVRLGSPSEGSSRPEWRRGRWLDRSVVRSTEEERTTKGTDATEMVDGEREQSHAMCNKCGGVGNAKLVPCTHLMNPMGIGGRVVGKTRWCWQDKVRFSSYLGNMGDRNVDGEARRGVGRSRGRYQCKADISRAE